MLPNIRKREGENLTDSAIESVISKLESDTPITKKDACAILSISYNTSRLKTIIDGYKDEKEYIARRKKEVRNTPISTGDASYMVASYLEGRALQEISNIVFRSVAIIKRTLSKYNIPIRNSSVTYQNPIDLECESLPAAYEVGNLVYSARYDSTAEVRKVIGKGVYRIWLFNDNQYAYQPEYELADLKTVQKELGVTLEYLSNDECQQLVAEGLRNARKKVKE